HDLFIFDQSIVPERAPCLYDVGACVVEPEKRGKFDRTVQMHERHVHFPAFEVFECDIRILGRDGAEYLLSRQGGDREVTVAERQPGNVQDVECIFSDDIRPDDSEIRHTAFHIGRNIWAFGEDELYTGHYSIEGPCFTSQRPDVIIQSVFFHIFDEVFEKTSFGQCNSNHRRPPLDRFTAMPNALLLYSPPLRSG